MMVGDRDENGWPRRENVMEILGEIGKASVVRVVVGFGPRVEFLIIRRRNKGSREFIVLETLDF